MALIFGPLDELHPAVRTALEAGEAPDRIVIHRHADLPPPIDSAAAFARAVGCAPGQVAKTLLLARAGAAPDDADGLALACLGSPERLSFAAAAAALGWSRCAMAPRGALERRLGQPPGGVSPLAPGGLPVLVDRSLAGYDRVMVGAGRLGLDIELPTRLLLALSGGAWHAIAEPRKEG
jgi:prolyl-tRNA editing enzyme YbaK/EbsC (Cys-tRNA(Pro) deacylase)